MKTIDRSIYHLPLSLTCLSSSLEEWLRHSNKKYVAGQKHTLAFFFIYK